MRTFTSIRLFASVGIMSALLVFSMPSSLFSQEAEAAYIGVANQKPVLIDEFGRATECEFRARVDNFLAELAKNPQLQGYIINYNGINVLPAEFGLRARERMIANHIAFRRFDAQRITLVSGGFREDFASELWLVPPGAPSPEPSRSLPKPDIPKDRSLFFDKSYLGGYEYAGLSDEYILPSVLEKERLEFENEEDEETDEAPDEDVEAEETAYEETSLTPEEIEQERFHWISEALGTFLVENPKHSAVLVFYADDQRYDVGKLHSLVSEGATRLKDFVRGRTVKITVVFGGYRSDPEVEFWVVPPDGTDPPLTPDTRPADECEDVVSES